jgi:hypothetical protein
VHSAKKGQFVPLDNDPEFKEWLKTIEIPATCFAQIRWDLDRFGINEASLYGDLPALCSYLTWWHSLRPDE